MGIDISAHTIIKQVVKNHVYIKKKIMWKCLNTFQVLLLYDDKSLFIFDHLLFDCLYALPHHYTNDARLQVEHSNMLSRG